MPCTSAGEYIKPHALPHAHAEWCCLFGRKMRQFRVLLLLLICQLATPIPIFDKDGIGFHSGYQSAGFGESIRDWFRVLKNRIVGKWQDWFGNDGALPSLSPQDILNLDKTIESRVSSYPGLLLDLSDLSYDPKYDWGVRVGNWHIIRKVTGNNNIPDDNSDSDEWDIRPLMPNLPSPPMFGIDWPPNIYEFGIPETTRPPTTTPKIELTTLRQHTPQTVTHTEPILTSTESTATNTESAVSAEPIPLTTESLTTSTEPIVTSTEEILTSSESVVSNGEPSAITTEPIATSAEPIPLTTPSIITSTEPIVTPTEEIVSSTESVATNSEPISGPESTSESTVSSTESIMISTESIIPSTESIATSRSIITSTEPTLISTESTIIMASTEEMVTTTELSATSTELILPVYNKRIEENKTVSTTRKPRPASAEVIMF